MDGFSVAAERHIAAALRDARVENIELLPSDFRKRLMKEAQEITNKNVFGADYKKDRKGTPIEQGLGSAAQPTQQSIEAYKKYHKDDPDFAENLKKMETALAEFRAKKKSRDDGDDA